MKQNIKISNNDFEKLKEGKQTYIILDNDEIQNKDTIVLQCGNELLNVEITSKSKYNSLRDCFKILPVDLFGYNSLSEALKSNNDIKNINVYRLKIDIDKIEEINDKKLMLLIDKNSFKKNNVGHSNTNVYEVKTTDGKNAILKIQHLTNRNDLSEEYKRINWLQDKFRVPKIYYYNETKSAKYLLMEKLEGISAHKHQNFAFKIGKSLKQFHNISIENCSFDQNCVEKLMNNALSKMDIIYPQIQEIYPNMTKEEVISYIKENIPNDKVLVHGDYSLPNILINDSEQVGLIDLGDVSISSMYFDFFYLNKSLKRNKKQDQLDELLKGYGINKLDDRYMKWVEIVDKALF